MARRYKVLVNREMQSMTRDFDFQRCGTWHVSTEKENKGCKRGAEGCRVGGLCCGCIMMLGWNLEQVDRQVRRKVRTRVCGAQWAWVRTVLSWAWLSTLTALRLSHLICEAEIKCPLHVIITATKCSRAWLSNLPLTITFLDCLFFFFSFQYAQDNNAFRASGSCYQALKNECMCQIKTSIPLT